jgi:hypothetical protein
MDRRKFLATLSSFAALDAVPALGGQPRRTPNHFQYASRKVIVGTVMQSYWGEK